MNFIKPLFFEYSSLSPEIFLFFSSLIFFTYYIFPRYETKFYYFSFFLFSFMILFITFSLLLYNYNFVAGGIFFRGQLIIDPLSYFFKFVSIFFAFVFLFFSFFYLRANGILTFEFFLFFLLTILAVFFLSSSYDFLTVYVSIELQSLILYVLAARERYSHSSTEAGLKYFVIGGLASVLLLFGIVLIYGATGSTSFLDISRFLLINDSLNWALIVGVSFIFFAFFFKLGLAPFHVWLPDVYQGSPTVSTAFFATISKLGLLAVCIRLIYFVFYELFFYFQDFLILVSLVSLFVGTFGALYQTNLKRLFAYSGISHMGFIFLALSCGSADGLIAALIYIIVYLILNFIIFGVILFSWSSKTHSVLEDLNTLPSLSKSDPVLAVSFMLALFSLAGIPPLVGFFSKFYVLTTLIQSGFFITAVIAILLSVLSSFYYIRLIKILYFELSVENFFNFHLSFIPVLIFSYLTLFNFIFFIIPGPLFLFSSFISNYFFL
jgi:NADH-quinone oxidoreductase subunit N